MKNYIKILAIASLTVSAAACKESTEKKKNDLIKKYNKVLSVKDYQTAIIYLQEYLFIDSTKVEYKDSLARYFTLFENYGAAEIMAQQVVKEQPLNEDMQMLLANIDLQRGDELSGMSRIDKLFEATKDYKFIFKKGLVYAQAGQANKTFENIDKLMAVPDNEIKTIKVNMVSNPAAEQDVKIKAAALLLKAYAYLGGQQPDRKAAYPLLEEALSLQNNFEMAQALAQQAFPQGK